MPTSDSSLQGGSPEPGGIPAAWQARQKLGEGEGLDEVIVGAGVKARHAIVDGIPRSQDQHRFVEAVAAKVPKHLQAISARQPQIQHKAVNGLGRGEVVAVFAGEGAEHLVAFFFKAAAQAPLQAFLVFNDQHTMHGAASPFH